MKLKHIVLLFACLGMVSILSGQKKDHKQLKFKHLSLTEGLSQSSVLCIGQDRKGFLWFGTRDGLNKYDGRTFRTFRHSSQDPASLSHSLVKVIYEDPHAGLWVGTTDGLNKYIPETNTFKRFYFDQGTSGFGDNEIWSIAQADEEHLWIGSSSGLKKFNTRTGRFEDEMPGTREALFRNPTRALLKTGDNRLWIKTTENIGVYDVSSRRVKYYDYPDNSQKELNKNNLSVLYEDNEKNIWLGFKNGLALLNKATDRFELFHTIGPEGHRHITEVRSICEDYRGNLWIGTYKGLYVLNDHKDILSHYVHDENTPTSLGQNSVYVIFEDIKNDIWIGTYAGGVSYYDRSYDVFRHFASGTNNRKLNYNVVSAIVEDSGQNLWIGTEGGGINVYDRATGTFTYYTHDGDDANSLSANNIKAMIRDHNGHFWIGTHDGGLNFLDPSEKPFRFHVYKNIPGDENSISDNRIISLLEDHGGNIWIGTSGSGVNVLDRASGAIIRIPETEDITGKIIYTISHTPDKNMLLIGGNKGLCEIDTRTRKVKAVSYRGNRGNTHASRAVLCAYKGENGDIWIGTEGDGLYCYDPATMTSVKYGTVEGLPNDIVYGIVPDKDNNIWLSTNRGLCRLDPETLEMENFDEFDGLQSNEFNFGAYLGNTEGELFFGGVNGLTVFNPEDIRKNTFVPPVSITSVQVNNKPFLNVTDSVREIRLKYNQNVINLDFIALNYSQPGKNQYAYTLEGFDTDWNYVGNRTSATYTNLDDGTYLFKVKASNNDGVWNEAGASIAIKVLPAPWFTWWAYLVYALIAVGAIFQVRRYALVRIRERNELKQERLEKERIEEVNRMKLQLFTNISHDFRTPLTLIIGPLERLLKRENTDLHIRKQLEVMYRNASVLMELINQLLDFRKNESGKLHLRASENNIVPFVQHIKLAFDELAEIKGIAYTFSTTDEDIRVWFDKTQLKKVIFNLLSNAFKFTPDGGRISLRLSATTKKTKEYVRIEVTDNGRGIPEKNIRFVFDRYYQLGDHSGTGIGLALTKNLVELHHGKIKVKSRKNEGSRFRIILPLGREHLRDEQIQTGNLPSGAEDAYRRERSVYIEKEISTLDIDADKKAGEADGALASVLIVEDNPDVRAFITSVFAGKYNLLEAPDGKKAVKIAQSTDIDLIISDVMMPEMDGMELCDTIKSDIRTSHIPVILLTAKTSQEYQKAGYRTGADAYITKPFDADILEVRVANLLTSRKKLIEKFRKDLILQPAELTVTSADEVFLKKAIDLVEDNISNTAFTIQEFIGAMGMSRSVLYRKLKSLTGQSTSEFIRTIKLKRAAQLMEQTQMTIAEIAFDLGFNDMKNFRTSFQKQFNKLPSEYRNTK
ncbi:hybrid sensor histidine kinase/response regulator transcription factor [Sinomicrobium soli]|uniref:hybrid sensor histidine kinase/response regulator transcription factor n=1 Tax=Sinomicrobium sp. N-1-3-6 TaxID=2219864 RepID=UPI000DDA551A|nr:two-component regulator propeller domain-containing protein [Sinomicrobium sp. N-1-3-6]